MDLADSGALNEAAASVRSLLGPCKLRLFARYATTLPRVLTNTEVTPLTEDLAGRQPPHG